MSNDVMERLKRWIGSPEGKRHLDEMERQGEEQAAAVGRREELVAAIEEARRVRREELPRLRERSDEFYGAWQQERLRSDAARDLWSDTRGRLVNLSLDAGHTIDRSETLLRESANPRLRAIAERLRDQAVQWHHTANRLLVRETVGQFMEAYTRIVNAEEVDGLHTDLVAAKETVDALCLVPAPEETEIVGALEQAEAALLAIEGRMGRRGGGR